jgi:hypothetical protein
MSSSAFALPTMIRLGYNNCAACHVSPQGGGLLTPYGQGIDTAQSLKRRDISTFEERLRSLYDVRLTMGASLQNPQQGASTGASTARVMFRNALLLSSHTRVSYQAGIDSTLNRTTTATMGAADFVISKAVFEYRPKEGLAIQVGRDVLPTGLNLPDPEVYMRKQNDPTGTAYPIQAKAFIWTRRFELTPYVFGPGFDEGSIAARQHGGGAMGGVDIWKQRAVIGLATKASRSRAFDRDSVGAYARLGFGKWGVLGEHDFTERVARASTTAQANYVSGYTQLFVAPKEWLVPSLIVDDVVTSGATSRHVYRVSPALSMRLSDRLTIGFSTRQDIVTGPAPDARAYSVTVAVKSVR